MGKKTKYRCRYCGTDEICDRLRSWELENKRCAVCGHTKFDSKEVEVADVDYYEEEKEEEKPWGF